MVKACSECGAVREVAHYAYSLFIPRAKDRDLCVDCCPVPPASPYNPEANAMVQAARARAARRA